MTEVVLNAELREPGQTASRALRRNGRIPGVFYINGKDPIHFSVPTLSLRSIVYTAEVKLVLLDIPGKGSFASILQDITFDPVTDKIVHFDLLGVAAGKAVTVKLPIKTSGTSIGVREGGTLESVLHKLIVKADPYQMPEHIDVDITNLKLGGSIHVSEISVPNIAILDRPSNVIIRCKAPRGARNEENEGAKGGKKK